MNLFRGIPSLFTVALLFAGVGGTVAWRALGTTGGGEGPAAVSPDSGSVEPQAVVGSEVVHDTLWVRVTGAGVAEARRRSAIATRRDGVVEGVEVRENDAVAAGDVLVQLDTLEAAMGIDEAEAGLTSRRNELEAEMLTGGAIGDPELLAERKRNLRARLGLTEAESQLRRARMEMERTRVAAPFAGRVADIRAMESEYLASGAEVLTLVQLDPAEVRADVLESDLIHVFEGAHARVRFTALPGEAFEGRVTSVNPVIDEGPPRTGRTTVTLPNPGERIRPGMFARVTLQAEAFPDRILVPREAVVERDRREVVFLLSNPDEEGAGRSEWRYVTTGVRNDTHVEIVSVEGGETLEPGDVVLVDGHEYLAHDTRVRLVADSGP